MTRADLVKAMAESTGMSQTDVDKVLSAFFDEVYYRRANPDV